jgi:hypothetical protein
MGVPVTQEEFDRLLAEFSHSAFRLETQPAYELGYERAEFDGFPRRFADAPLRTWIGGGRGLTRSPIWWGRGRQ